MGKKCRRVLFYSVKCRNVENDIFGKGKTKNVVDAKSIEEFFFPFSVLSEFYLILYSAVAPITL